MAVILIFLKAATGYRLLLPNIFAAVFLPARYRLGTALYLFCVAALLLGINTAACPLR